ncbi:MAG: YceI family protein [Bacteroidota bacterium]
MKKSNIALLSIFALTLFFASCKNEAKKEEVATTDSTAANTLADGTYNIDVAASSVNWKGEMLALYNHYGTISIKEGTVDVKEGKIAGGNIVIDMSSITPKDSAYGKDNPKEKLIGHLASNDFFNTKDFAVSSFKITGSENNTVKGELTVRDKTNPETVKEVVVTPSANGMTASAKLIFNRQNYGVAFKMPVKDKVLSDSIQLDINLTATK